LVDAFPVKVDSIPKIVAFVLVLFTSTPGEVDIILIQLTVIDP